MHPQVHQDHPGECPICHMKLIKISNSQEQKEHLQHTGAPTSEERPSSTIATPGQLARIGVQESLVERMDLILHIPVSGRFISSSTVAFQVYESDLRNVKPGLAFKGENNLFPEIEVNGNISSVDSLVDPTSRTVRALGSIKNGPKSIIPETTFRGDIEIHLKNVLAIPESAVLHTGKSDIVYMVHGEGYLVAQNVKLGAKSEGYYEVLAGLSAGDFISSGPNFLIDSEAKIRGASDGSTGNKTPECPSDQHWDIPMAMCMPGKASQ